MPKTSPPQKKIANKVNLKPTLLAFKPRQVVLLRSNAPTMNNKTSILKPDQKTLLLRSIAQYLERNGFSKAFKKFRSEAKIEKDDLRHSFFDLEEVFYKFLEKCNYTSKEFKRQKVQDLHTDGISQRHGENDSATAVETVSNRKEKSSDSHAIDKQLGDGDKVDSKSFEEMITQNATTMDVKSKEKKGKKTSDSLGQEEQIRAEALKEFADNIACESPNNKGKDKKKKKSKLDSESVVVNVGLHASESLPKEAEEKSKNLVSEGKKVTDSEIENKSKDKKKKKNKLASESVVDNVECVSKGKKEADTVVLLDTKNTKSEGKRKKKDSSVSESLVAGDLKEPDGGKSNKIDSKKDDLKTSKGDLNDKQSKASKKRKRLPSEEDATHPADEKTVKESKHRKTEGLEEPKESEQSKKLKTSSGTDEKAHKEEGSLVGPSESQKTDGNVNGNLKNTGEKSALQKTTKKQQNGSVELKTVKHFQRVKVDEVVFSDERLRDNSYWAKDGAENGYGAKAQEILEQVRGRDFRHEKTKKKRGTYRGGVIDLQSHSIKFNYSDDD